MPTIIDIVKNARELIALGPGVVQVSTQDLAALCDAADEMLEMLDGMAAWWDGPVVTGKFDCPDEAREARKTLAKLGITGPLKGLK